jgi:hypothetical protein
MTKKNEETNKYQNDYCLIDIRKAMYLMNLSKQHGKFYYISCEINFILITKLTYITQQYNIHLKQKDNKAKVLDNIYI